MKSDDEMACGGGGRSSVRSTRGEKSLLRDDATTSRLYMNECHLARSSRIRAAYCCANASVWGSKERGLMKFMDARQLRHGYGQARADESELGDRGVSCDTSLFLGCLCRKY